MDDEIDYEYDHMMISEFAEHVYEKGRLRLYAMPERFQKYNDEVRRLTNDLLAETEGEFKGGVSGMDAVYTFLSVSALNAMIVMDQMVSPADKGPPEFREAWAKVKSDWRASVLGYMFQHMIVNMRMGQMLSNRLPIDMMTPEGGTH